jgi:hypothetical protein
MLSARALVAVERKVMMGCRSTSKKSRPRRWASRSTFPVLTLAARNSASTFDCSGSSAMKMAPRTSAKVAGLGPAFAGPQRSG